MPRKNIKYICESGLMTVAAKGIIQRGIGMVGPTKTPAIYENIPAWYKRVAKGALMTKPRTRDRVADSS